MFMAEIARKKLQDISTLLRHEIYIQVEDAEPKKARSMLKIVFWKKSRWKQFFEYTFFVHDIQILRTISDS